MRALLFSLSLVISVSALADWPMARANPQRTGASTKALTITKPVIAWRKYLGGSLRTGQLEALDVDGNKSVDIVLISGGKLVAKQPDDTVIWETHPLALDTIQQIEDFDGDGKLEIVASGSAAFLGIFSAHNGKLLWRARAGTFGTVIGAVRVADLNRDGKKDLYAADIACGSVNGKRVSIAWSFADGYKPDDGAQRLWQLPDNRDYQCGYHDVVADLDQDGALEVVAFSVNTAFVYDGATGQALPASTTSAGYPLGFSIPYGGLRTTLADVDGTGKLSIIGTTNNTYTPSINSRALTVLTWNRSLADAQRLTVRWLHNVPDLTNDQHHFIDDNAIDLDADGKAEVISTFYEGGVLRAAIYNGATGAVLSSMNAAVIRSVLKLGATERPTLIVETTGAGAKLQGYRFDVGIGAVFGTPVFEIPVRALVQTRSAAINSRASASNRLLTVPLSNGHTGVAMGDSTVIELWDLSAPSAPVAMYPLPSGVTALAAAGQTNVSGAGPGMLLARSDGFLIALNSKLEPVNFQGGGELSLPGIRTGGFYSGSRDLGQAPVAGKLGAATEEILVVDSLARLLRLDASHASQVIPPETRWTLASSSYPTLLDTDSNGVFDLLLTLSGPDVSARTLDTTEVFRHTLNTVGWSHSGAMLPLAGTTPQRYAMPQSNSGTGEGRVLTFDATGVKWASTPIVTAGSGQGQLATDDLDGDGLDDVYGHFQSAFRAYNATDGALMGNGPGTYPTSPITVRGRAGAVTTLSAGAVVGNQGLTTTRPFTGFTSAWERQLPDRFATGFAAVAQCANTLVWGNTGYASTHLVVAGVETGELRADLVLAGGARFADDDAATDAGALRGNLGNVNASGGAAPTMLVGSTDGQLYAVDPCARPPALRWSVDLRSPVGEAILTDFDGDGAEELVVEAADGFVYGIDQEQFPAPAMVIDTDSAQPTAVGDVNETSARQLSAQWSAVPNATGYQYAVFTAGGTALTRNPSDPGDPFIAVAGTVTSASHGEMLQAGNRYFFAVKALGASGSSGETLSNGTRWVPGSIDAGTLSTGDAGTLDAGSVDGGVEGPTKIGGTGNCGCSGGAGLTVIAALALLSRVGRKKP